MNILMIHGIGQEQNTQADLLKIWTDTINNEAPGLLDNLKIDLPYYGTILASMTDKAGSTAISMGGNATSVNLQDKDQVKFLSSVMEELVESEGLGKSELEAAILEAQGNHVPMDNFIYRRLNGLLRLIEKISPAKGSILLKVIKQGHTYLSVPAAAAAVDQIVQPFLEKSPQIIITHSLGTVIAFKLLREMKNKGIQIEVPLFITMGSPLALDAFKAKLGPPRLRPTFVKKWVNFFDPSDFVTLGKPLDQANFAAEILNDGTVDNTTFNAHGVVGYLPHKGVIDELKLVL